VGQALISAQERTVPPPIESEKTWAPPTKPSVGDEASVRPVEVEKGTGRFGSGLPDSHQAGHGGDRGNPMRRGYAARLGSTSLPRSRSRQDPLRTDLRHGATYVRATSRDTDVVPDLGPPALRCSKQGWPTPVRGISDEEPLAVRDAAEPVIRAIIASGANGCERESTTEWASDAFRAMGGK